MNESHFDNLLDLIEIEREAEKEENKRELEKFPLHVREALGIAAEVPLIYTDARERAATKQALIAVVQLAMERLKG